MKRALVLFVVALASIPTPGRAEPVRLTRDFDGVAAEVEVRGLERGAAIAAARAALDAVWRVHVMAFGTSDGTVHELETAAGAEVVLHEELARELQRGIALCAWSGGAWGPLAGRLTRLWAGTAPAPQPSELREAVGTTACSRLVLQASAEGPPMGSLSQGTEVDLGGLLRGWAADDAVRELQKHDVANAIVVVGNVIRGLGGGPEGTGWPITLPPAGGSSLPMDVFWLRDRAIAFHTPATMRGRPIVDQRTGTPTQGVAGVVVSGSLAADAQGLATALWILGHREGHLRLGALKPRPAVLLFLGQGRAEPVESSYAWYDVIPQIR